MRLYIILLLLIGSICSNNAQSSTIVNVNLSYYEELDTLLAQQDSITYLSFDRFSLNASTFVLEKQDEIDVIVQRKHNETIIKIEDLVLHAKRPRRDKVEIDGFQLIRESYFVDYSCVFMVEIFLHPIIGNNNKVEGFDNYMMKIHEISDFIVVLTNSELRI